MNVKMSPPWVVYWRELEALFGQDPEIEIEFDEDALTIDNGSPNCSCYIYVNNGTKAEALNQLLPTKKVFGNVTLYIDIIPTNTDKTLAQYYVDAFTGNPIFEGRYCLGEGSAFHYMVFKNEVVQFYSDTLADPNGYTSTLYQDIANKVFNNHDGIYFCTARK